MKSKFSYQSMKSLSIEEMRNVLHQLKLTIDNRICMAIEGVTNPIFVKNRGAIDKVFLNDKYRREIYFAECEQIVKELNELGHKLVSTEIDSDKDFEYSNLSWTSFKGLDLEFFPKSTKVLWVISPKK